MDITLKPFRATGHPKPVASFKVTEKSWKIFTYHSQLSDFYELAKNLEKKEKIQAQTMLMQLGQRCESGQPLENMYDSKKLHDSCIFQFIIGNTQKEDKIYNLESSICKDIVKNRTSFINTYEDVSIKELSLKNEYKYAIPIGTIPFLNSW